MLVGDVVIPRDGKITLFCGSGIYTHAICVSTNPYIMISEHGDMLWTHEEAIDYVPLCQVHPDILKVCMNRLKREKKSGILRV